MCVTHKCRNERDNNTKPEITSWCLCLQYLFYNKEWKYEEKNNKKEEKNLVTEATKLLWNDWNCGLFDDFTFVFLFGLDNEGRLATDISL